MKQSTLKDRFSKSATASSGRNTSPTTFNDDEQNINNQPSVRNLVGLIEKFERAEIQELLSSMTCNWLLSLDDFKLPIEYPTGLITQMTTTNDNHILILMPFDDTIPHMDYREIHQIIRELTVGIFVLNQYPSLVLDTNFDESTTCILPPAYQDTKLGQIMINTDYWLKALWHGSFFPRDKRIKFTERWRQMFDVDSNGIAQTRRQLITEFLSAGLQDTSKDPEYANVYDETYQENIKMKYLSNEQNKEDMKFFMHYVDELSVQMTMYIKSIKSFKNLYEMDADYTLNATIKATNERINSEIFERIKTRLNKHETHLRETFANKQEIRKNLNILKLVSFLIPLFIGMKRRMKIPDLNNLLPAMTGDDVRTERELPPLMLGSDFKCKSFDFSLKQSEDASNRDKYFNLHGGIQFEIDTVAVNTQFQSELHPDYNEIYAESTDLINRYLQSEIQLQDYPVGITEINKKKYYCIKIETDNYHSQYPQKPYWINKLYDDLLKLKPKRLPMTDINIYDLLKKYFGYKRATKLKNPSAGLKASAQRGLVGIFQSFSRKTPSSRLAKQDENGLGLMHYAAIYNRPLIIASLILSTVDVNIKQQIDYLAVGPMPLHYAAKCGSLDSASCLISNYANISFTDHQGWAPIHYAAYFDNTPVLKLLVRKQEEVMELITRNDLKWTPILLAASAGSLESIKCLIDLGANWTHHDERGYNMIHLAAHRNHTNIIGYFVTLNHPNLQATFIIINMLKSVHEQDQCAAVKCLEGMTNENKNYCNQILEANGIDHLINILRVNSTLSSNQTIAKSQLSLKITTLSVLCNVSDNNQIRQRLSSVKDIGTILHKLLQSKIDDIQSRAAILLADIASLSLQNRDLFVDVGCLDDLIKLLDSETEDVLVNSINAIEVLCQNNPKTQVACATNNVLIYLVNLLSLNSDLIKAAVAAAIAAIVVCNSENQLLALKQNVAKALIDLLKTRNVTVQLKVALALEALATDNFTTQKAILDLGAADHMINLLKIKANTEDWSIVVREQAACTLWALAGSNKPQRKLIAEKVGVLQIIIMLLSTSERLQYVGCKCVIALVNENIYYQRLLTKENAIEILLKLLRNEKTSEQVTIIIVQTIAALCIDVAHVNNKETQFELASKGAFEILLKLLDNAKTKDIKIETAHSIACLLLGNTENESVLDHKLDMGIIIELLREKDKELRLSAGHAVTILAYNNIRKQYQIKMLGGISFHVYDEILHSNNEIHICKACFQLVILAKVINDRDKVWVTAVAIAKLVNLLNSVNENVVVQTASYMASLSHTRAGITDAMITCDVVDILCEKVFHANQEIRFSCAVALGYLTFNRTAARLLLHNCRNNTSLYKTLMDNLREDSKINHDFVMSYETALKLGLPKLLVQNKVRFAQSAKETNEYRVALRRAKTVKPTMIRNGYTGRSQSAPQHLSVERISISSKKTGLRAAFINHSTPIDNRKFTSSGKDKAKQVREEKFDSDDNQDYDVFI